MSTRVRQSAGDRVFEAVVLVFVVLAVLLCVVPLFNVVALSLSSNSAILNQKKFSPMNTPMWMTVIMWCVV